MDPPKRMKWNPDCEKEVPVMVPVLADDLVEDTPTVDAYYDTVRNKRDISKVITELNRILPLYDFGHLKRMRKKDVLLSPVAEMDQELLISVLRNNNFDMSRLEDDIRIAEVAKVAPQTRIQFQKVNKLWPCNFHPNKYLENLTNNELFTKKEIDEHVVYMKIAIDVAKYAREHYSDSSKVGVTVVDPNLNSVVAVGYRSVSDAPCRHAVMVAIDNVAKTQNGGAWENCSETASQNDLDLRGFPQDMLKFLRSSYSATTFGATLFKGKNELASSTSGPYLCTGYYVYVTTEPCIMCAMALVHSRAKRIFYGTKSEFGALGTICKVHTVRDLNHHYEAFAGLLKNECSEL